MSDTDGRFDQNPPPHDLSILHDYLDIVDPDGHNDAWVWNDQDYLEAQDDWGIHAGRFEELFAVDNGSGHASSLDNGVRHSNSTVDNCNAARMEALGDYRILLSVS